MYGEEGSMLSPIPLKVVYSSAQVEFKRLCTQSQLS